MEKYNKIISAFLAGEVEGIEEKGTIPEHVETQISNVFLFPKTVYKICKRDNHFFNEHFRNLADRQSRIDFYKSDFFENNYFSPDVYLDLYGIDVDENGKVVVSKDIDTSEDVIMKMRRIDLRLALPPNFEHYPCIINSKKLMYKHYEKTQNRS